MKRIAQLYLPNDSFADEANQTIGAPGVTGDILMNRRMVTDKLTDAGRKHLENVREFLKKKYGIEVHFKWNIKCGCRMCPCSPGFDVKIKTQASGGNLSDDKGELATIWVASDGTIDFREPRLHWKYDYYIECAKNMAA